MLLYRLVKGSICDEIGIFQSKCTVVSTCQKSKKSSGIRVVGRFVLGFHHSLLTIAISSCLSPHLSFTFRSTLQEYNSHLLKFLMVSFAVP